MTFRSILGGLAVAAGLLALPADASAQSVDCGPGYRILRGDTLAGIARACDISPEALRRANPRIDWDVPRIGAPIRIPEPGDRRAQPSRGPADVYVIRRGDDLASVARALGVSVDALLDANPGLRERDLVPGREIRLGGRDRRGPSPDDVEIAVRERSVEPGEVATVDIEGLPPRAPVTVRAGPDGGRPITQRQGRAGRDGTATVEIDVPARARGGERWRVEALDPRGRPVADATFRVSGRDGGGNNGGGGRRGVTVSGLLTREGVECPALRSEDGDLYTLYGRIDGFRAGDSVTVTGRVAEISTCQQGTTIEVERIDADR
jgi:LysM repeat protein